MTKALFLVDTINGFPMHWKKSFDSIVQFRQFLQEQDLHWETYVPVEENLQLVEMQENHRAMPFLNEKFNGECYSLGTLLKSYLNQCSIQGSDITEVFYFSELGGCSFSVPPLFPNANFTLVCFQNGKETISKNWTEEDMKKYEVDTWRFLNRDEWLNVVEVELSKQKLEAHLPQAQSSLFKPHL